ncbi:MAG: 50S ribosomal protein L11 methyltransferase [Clostridia bacterium]|nr:50S ribosomal protein L11 methyltransferase [Clostridia bacterium]
MQWTELIIHTTTAGSDAVSNILIDLGANGTMVEDRADVPDPDKPHGFWEIIDPAMIDAMPEDVLVHAWFDPEKAFARTLEQLMNRLALLQASAGCDVGSLKVEQASVRDEDWSEVWKQFYKPFHAGKRLVVKPTWEAYEAGPEDLVIEMDPGMAFGSGTHETTSMCLELLEEAVQGGEDVIDVGTGSGILAIGAARLGAWHVLAVDIDPDAVRVARENVRINGLEDRIEAVQGNLLERTEAKCEVCVANIIADVICMFAEPLTRHIAPGGRFVCSGILKEKEQMVTDALLANGYELLKVLRKGSWVAMLSRRPLS